MTSTEVPAVDLVVNGRDENVAEGTTLLDLLQDRQLGAKLVAVERNGEIVPKDEFESTRLERGDRLEIVHFVGGG